MRILIFALFLATFGISGLWGGGEKLSKACNDPNGCVACNAIPRRNPFEYNIQDAIKCEVVDKGGSFFGLRDLNLEKDFEMWGKNKSSSGKVCLNKESSVIDIDEWLKKYNKNYTDTLHTRLRAGALVGNWFDLSKYLDKKDYSDRTVSQVSVTFNTKNVNKKYVKFTYSGPREQRVKGKPYPHLVRSQLHAAWPFSGGQEWDKCYSCIGYRIVDKTDREVTRSEKLGGLYEMRGVYNFFGAESYCTRYRDQLACSTEGVINWKKCKGNPDYDVDETWEPKDTPNQTQNAHTIKGKQRVFCMARNSEKVFLLQRVKGGESVDNAYGIDIDFDIEATDVWDPRCGDKPKEPDNPDLDGIVVSSPGSYSLFTQVVNLPFNIEMKNTKKKSEFDISSVKEIYIYPSDKTSGAKLKVAKCDDRNNCFSKSGEEKIAIYSKGESTTNIESLMKDGKAFKVNNIVIPNPEFNDKLDLKNLTFKVGVIYDDGTSKEYSDGDTFVLRPAGYEFLKSDGAAFSDKDRASNLKIAGERIEFNKLGNIQATYCMNSQCNTFKSAVVAYERKAGTNPLKATEVKTATGTEIINSVIWDKDKDDDITKDCVKSEAKAQTYKDVYNELPLEIYFTYDKDSNKQKGQACLTKNATDSTCKLAYPEVGPSVIYIKDIDWTKNDQDNNDCVKDSSSNDNSNGDGKVGCNIESKVKFYTFKPGEIQVTAKIGNSGDISYYIFDTKDPYFSNDEKKVFDEFALAPKLEISFQALLHKDTISSDARIAPNLYTGKCYAMNNEAMVDLSSNSKLHNAIIHLFSYDDANATSKYRAKISENSVKASGNLMAYRALFYTNDSIKSKAKTEFRVNLNRKFDTPKDPTMLNNLDIKITGGKETQPGSGGADDPESGNKDKFKEFYGDGGSSVTDGTDGKIDGEANVFYGKAYSPSFFSNKKKDDEPIYYGVYCSAICKSGDRYKNSSGAELITTDEPSKVTSDGFYKAPSFNTENVENGDADDFVAKKVGSNDDASGKISASNFENNKPKAGEQKVDLEYSKTGRVTIRNYMKDPAYGRTFATKYDETGSANKKYWHEIDATFGSSNNGKWRGYGDEGNVLGDNPERTNAKRFNNRVDW